MVKARGVVTIAPPSSWVSSTTAEFGPGVVDAGAYLADTAGGEVTLAPAAGIEFSPSLVPLVSSNALPGGWTSTPLANSGTAIVGKGVIAIDMATVLAPNAYEPGHTLEFVATFSGGANQNAGFGLTSALVAPFAMFGTKTDGVFYARSVAPGQTIETPIAGSWFNAPHRFQIDFNATTVVYWIDGMQVVSHTITYPANTVLRPAATDGTAGGGVLTVDWMRMSPYAASGIYTSPVYNAGAPVVWTELTWLADIPASGGTVLVEVRTGSTPLTAAGTNWTAFSTIARPGDAIGATAQYVQYRLTLATTVTNAAPAVKEVVANFVK
jgi:hypothetical protein